MASKFLNISVDDTLGGNSPSDDVVSSQKALKTYIDSHGGGGGSVSVDGVTINKNSSDELQAIGLINKNPSGSTIYDWEGTLAQYEAQNVETLHPEWTCLITDDLSPNIYPMRNLGEIVQSTIPLTDAGLHLLDGSLISGSGAYADFVTYIAGLVSTYPDLFDTEANWQQSVTDYGVCGKFVYDSVNSTVRLPKITGFTEGTITPTTLGDLTQAGLPNITGDFWAGMTQGIFLNDGTGAFAGKSGAGGTQVPATGGAYSANNRWDMDASRSSSIYGNSTTVQPQSIKVLYYICIATATKTNIEVDIDEIATDLNGKADVDLSNCTVLEPCHVVIETYVNGTEWYRVYDDGWCEQGGEYTAASITINFLKPFIDTNYNIQTSVSDGSPTDYAFTTCSWNNKTTNSVILYCGYNSTVQSTSPCDWRACGYIN